MKNIIILFFSLFLNSQATKANNIETPFVFIEKGVEYAVFNNGEFDFTILKNRRTNSNINIYSKNINISFNSGHNYKTYIERNRYGDIIAIDNTNIYYDYNGKVNQIGSVCISYNRYGDLLTIGNLNIHQNRYANNYSCTGYINQNNRQYSPICKQYKKPIIHHHLYRTRSITSRSQTYYGPRNNYRNYNRYYKRNSIKRYSKHKKHNNNDVKSSKRKNKY